MRMELLSFGQVLFNPVAQAKFVPHRGCRLRRGFGIRAAVSAWYLLRGRNVEHREASMARSRRALASPCALSSSLLGDESGYLGAENQKMKIARRGGVAHRGNRRRASRYSDFGRAVRARHTRR